MENGKSYLCSNLSNNLCSDFDIVLGNNLCSDFDIDLGNNLCSIWGNLKL